MTRTFRALDGRDVQVLDGLCTQVWPGRLTALRDRSGSGKTTGLSIAAGLLECVGAVVTLD